MTLSAGESSQAFAAEAESTGSAGNASSGVFTRHNFTNYADSRYGSLLVTNNYGLIGGRDEEEGELHQVPPSCRPRNSPRAGEAVSKSRGGATARRWHT